MAESSIARARRLAKEKREKREAQEAADKKAAEPKPEEKEESGFFESIRKAFSSDDDIKRIDDAVDAMTSGIKKADEET
ncbi:MAG: hypothetical protein J3T61_11610 [Candidatus Brocadiales bacterium]|nr:hypothetical protein [Candidatus Bathyanammoxibius sp.]